VPRIGGHHVPGAGATLFVAEAIVLACAARAGWAIGSGARAAAVLTIAGGCALALQLAFYWADLYDVRVAADDARRGRRLLGAIGATFAIAIPASVVLPAKQRAGLAFALAAAGIGAAALRALAPWEPLRRKVFVLGNGDALQLLLRELEACEDVTSAIATESPKDLVQAARRAHSDLVVTAFDERRGIPARELLACRLAGIEVLEAAAYVERARRKIPTELLRPASLIYQDGFRRSRVLDGMRRAMSVAVAGLLVVVFALPMLAIAVCIRLDGSRGPVLYKQVRVGRGGVRYEMWKFRTMRPDAEAQTGAVWARERDPRITRVGGFLRRTRLDELPQLFNVLAGDMDLVGPRPERPELIAMLERELPYYDVRSLVRPGLTGWAQIRYPYGASIEDARQKLAFDLYYVKRASPLLDAIVLFHTAKVVVMGRGAR
jgi:exopolysaccharide biosynthesis polyprenyl glycosylphosphotransferase